MRKLELDAILSAMLQTFEGISDLNFSVGRPLQVESFGELREIQVDPSIPALTPYQTQLIALNIIGRNKRLLNEFLMFGSCDTGYSLSSGERFRVNIFKQRGNFAVVMRRLQAQIPSIESLQLPPIFEAMAAERTGFILITGATGSGKTTTMAALLNEINRNQAVHIVTLEDPIEFVHPHLRATFNQRELGQDFDSYPTALRASLRQAPKVILVGEMRDRETAEIAINAAETGHLVLSTLHTINAGQTINRLLGMFEQEEEATLRLRLADTLRYVVSQRLAPQIGGGRKLLSEIMGNNLRTRETIALGEDENRSFYDIIESNSAFGWHTFDQSLLSAYEAELITEEVALAYATSRPKVTRGIDDLKKIRGTYVGEESGLRLDSEVFARR